MKLSDLSEELEITLLEERAEMTQLVIAEASEAGGSSCCLDMFSSSAEVTAE